MGKSDKVASMRLMVKEMNREMSEWDSRNSTLEKAAFFAEVDGMKELAEQIRKLKR